jgi:putative chitobiose transport system permease protein
MTTVTGGAGPRVGGVAAGRRPTRWGMLAWYGVLLGVAAFTVIPFLWLLSTSLKGPEDAVVAMPPELLPGHPTFDNYVRVWERLPVWRFFLNSLIVAAATVVLNLVVSALAAYPLAKMRFPGREAIFYLLLATLIVPAELTYIPGFLMAVQLFQYIDTLQSLILPGIFSAFNIFLLRQAFQTVPDELIDAARIDGAGEFRIWWQILLPTIRPTLATTAIFTAVGSWNSLLWPSLMLRTRELYTLPIGLNSLRGMFESDFRAVAAGAIMTVIPIMIFFIALQRQFVRGLTSGAVKG